MKEYDESMKENPETISFTDQAQEPKKSEKHLRMSTAKPTNSLHEVLLSLQIA
jgi:hypothetical protein